MAMVSNVDARTLLRDTLSPAVRGAVDVNQVAQSFTVVVNPDTSLSELDAIAARINQQIPGVKATKPSEVVQQIKSINTTFTAIFTGSALLALLIGGLSVVNTMIMAVSERVREIGLKKAVGAHTRHLVAEYVLEAGVIGFIGGLAGYLLGVGLTTLVDTLGSSSNLDLFLITPNLTFLAIGFATGLGALAGVVPAFRAARMDPVTALRTSN